MRIGTQHVSPPTATFFTVVVGAVWVCGTAFAVNFDEIKALPPVAYGWITIMGILAYPVARVLQNSAISMVGAAPCGAHDLPCSPCWRSLWASSGWANAPTCWSRWGPQSSWSGC